MRDREKNMGWARKDEDAQRRMQTEGDARMKKNGSGEKIMELQNDRIKEEMGNA